MTIIRTLIVMMCMTVVSALAFAQSAPPPPRINPSEAKSHAGDTVTVCGKVVDTKVSRYGLAGRGKPVTFDIDQPEPGVLLRDLREWNARRGNCRLQGQERMRDRQGHGTSWRAIYYGG